ncbi:uncharacterized protein TrAtP1_001188 [Trichoderma atroviride]|uniref:uncharacterized protein n=1 Tax=Hypocrea atroviridis TaxID=63577 RepID=UPI00332CD2A8|nr:hypothetical protein TrAtP1_001188 [Trichoderma atroviride]
MVTELPYALDAETPLNPSELSVLRAQFEKEGEMVGVQTKFNYAWGLVKSNNRNDQQLGVRLLSDIFRVSPRAPPRMPLLPRPRQLQARQLRRGPPLQRPPPRQGACQPPGHRPAPTHRRQGRQGGPPGRRHY